MKIKRFKLNALSAEGLRLKEMNAIIGGRACGCSCYYANNGGSSSTDNMNANYAVGDNGTDSTQGCNPYFKAATAHIPYIPDTKA